MITSTERQANSRRDFRSALGMFDASPHSTTSTLCSPSRTGGMRPARRCSRTLSAEYDLEEY